MKSLLLFIFLIGYFASSRAQTNERIQFSGYSGSLTGRVVDSATGNGIPSATIYIADLKLGAMADEKGNYKFSNLPTGTYLVEAHAIGHTTQIKNVTITDKVVQDFNLGLQYTEESPVVITGMSKATQIRRSPVPL